MSIPFEIQVEVRYIARESDPDKARHVFAYTITISNRGSAQAQLMNRYWRITDGEGQVAVCRVGSIGRVASDDFDVRGAFSNYGDEIFICAPGVTAFAAGDGEGGAEVSPGDSSSLLCALSACQNNGRCKGI